MTGHPAGLIGEGPRRPLLGPAEHREPRRCPVYTGSAGQRVAIRDAGQFKVCFLLTAKPGAGGPPRQGLTLHGGRCMFGLHREHLQVSTELAAVPAAQGTVVSTLAPESLCRGNLLENAAFGPGEHTAQEALLSSVPSECENQQDTQKPGKVLKESTPELKGANLLLTQQ